MSEVVLDASALLALLNDEPGSDVVAMVLSGAAISTVNLAEVIAKLTAYGLSDEEVGEALGTFGLEVTPFDETHAYIAGGLYRSTRPFGLSLGDRACLALAKQNGLPVMTADRAWAGLEIGIEVRVIRE